jgi:ketol-acid reductoisomerase
MQNADALMHDIGVGRNFFIEQNFGVRKEKNLRGERGVLCA